MSPPATPSHESRLERSRLCIEIIAEVQTRFSELRVEIEEVTRSNVNPVRDDTSAGFRARIAVSTANWDINDELRLVKNVAHFRRELPARVAEVRWSILTEFHQTLDIAEERIHAKRSARAAMLHGKPA
jgi:hypothetical protein